MARASKSMADRVAEYYIEMESTLAKAGFEFTKQKDGMHFHKTPPDSDALREFFASVKAIKKKGIWFVAGNEPKQKEKLSRLSLSLRFFRRETDPDVLRRRAVQNALIDRMEILLGERRKVLSDAGFYLQFVKNSVILPPNFFMTPYRECLRKLQARWIAREMRWFAPTPTDADREMVIDALIPLAPIFAAETAKQTRLTNAKIESNKLVSLLVKTGTLSPGEWVALSEARAVLREVDDGRLLVPAHALPKKGQLVRVEDRVRRITRVGKCFVLNIEHAHIFGSYLQPYMGEDGAFVYFDEGVVEPSPAQAVIELLKSRES